MSRSAAGFSLLELVIAMAMASVVLGGLYGILTAMVRFQAEGIRKSAVVTWSLASGGTMVKDCEDANVLAYPTAASGDQDILRVCQNWSRHAGSPPNGGALDPTLPVRVVTYCYDGVANGRIRRIVQQGVGVVCPAAAPSGCAGGEVMAVGVNRFQGAPVFSLDPVPRGARVRFIIGRDSYAGPTAGTPDRPMPVYEEVNIGLAMSRVYTNNLD